MSVLLRMRPSSSPEGDAVRYSFWTQTELNTVRRLLTIANQALKDTFLAMVDASVTNIAGTLVLSRAAATNNATGT